MQHFMPLMNTFLKPPPLFRVFERANKPILALVIIMSEKYANMRALLKWFSQFDGKGTWDTIESVFDEVWHPDLEVCKQYES